MKRFWLALLFFAGGFAHEVRQPFECHTLVSRVRVIPRGPREDADR